MCGRYTLTSSAAEVADHFDLDEAAVAELAAGARYNIAPTQSVPVVRVRGGRRALELRRWGLVPHWARDLRIGARLINARVETVAEKAAFRQAYRRRRCLVPANGFYEWKAHPRRRRPHYIQLCGGALFGFAGLYERWRGASAPAKQRDLLPPADETPVESFTLLTTEANARIRPLHDRMPVILPPEAYARWLDPQLEDPDTLSALLREAAPVAEGLVYHPVGWQVNRPAHDAADCIRELALPSPDEAF